MVQIDPVNEINTMSNTIKITTRYSNLTDAVAATGMDLSYNEADARQTIRTMERDQRLKLVAIFSDETNQIWYVINSVGENLNLLHKFNPFRSMMSDSPFNGYIATKSGAMCGLNDCETLNRIGSYPKTTQNRRLMAKAGVIAG